MIDRAIFIIGVVMLTAAIGLHVVPKAIDKLAHARANQVEVAR